MKWEKVKLGNVTDSCLGKMLDQNKNKGDYQPYLANVNVRWGEFDLEDLPLMKFEESEQERYELKYGDLVICEGGEPGRCAIWKEQIPNMKIQKALHRVRVHDCLDYRYLFYWFLLAGKTGELDQYFTGATIKHMPGQKLKEVVIDKPPLEIQHRIADILSAYDNLIENNQKQIKLLEEAAQRLYKEWFVDLRFPGHENTKIVDGVPEGWSRNPIQDFISYEIGGGWGEELQNEKSMIPAYVIRGTDIKGLVNGQLQNVPYRYHTAGSLETRKLLDGDIVFEVSGGSKTEGVARTVRIIDLMLKTWENSVICASFCKRIKPIPSFSQYLYDSFRWMRLNGKTQEYDKKSASSIVNYRWKDFLAQEKILKPDEETISRYNNIAGTIYTEIIVCSCQIEQAKMKRDLLLPKLMNGEVEV